MRRIFAAIVGAIKAVFGYLGRVAGAPFAALAGIGGGGPPPPLEFDDEPADAAEKTAANASAIAGAVLRWSADSAIDDAPAPMPDAIPAEVREWLRGLAREHVYAILDADERAISAHLQGVFFIDGLPRVGPLHRAEWKKSEPTAHHDAGSDNDLRDDSPSRSHGPG